MFEFSDKADFSVRIVLPTSLIARSTLPLLLTSPTLLFSKFVPM